MGVGGIAIIDRQGRLYSDVQQLQSCFETWQHIKCKWDVFTIMIINIVVTINVIMVIYVIMIVYVIMIIQYITDKVLIIVFKVLIIIVKVIIIKVLMIVNQEIAVIAWNNLKPV